MRVEQLTIRATETLVFARGYGLASFGILRLCGGGAMSIHVPGTGALDVSLLFFVLHRRAVLFGLLVRLARECPRERTNDIQIQTSLKHVSPCSCDQAIRNGRSC